jgi:hypothetical protein
MDNVNNSSNCGSLNMQPNMSNHCCCRCCNCPWRNQQPTPYGPYPYYPYYPTYPMWYSGTICTTGNAGTINSTNTGTGV